MDCLDRSISETESPPPFQHLVTDQAKSFLALQELQNEVGALLEFRDLVIESFPHLKVKMASSCLATPTPTPSHTSPAHSHCKWEPGVRVRRKLVSTPTTGSQDIAASLLPRSRSNSHGKGPKSGETCSAGSSAVQDSGFCTESKDHSASSSATSGGAGGGRGGKNKEVEDELMNLLDMIQAKGTALRLEVDYLQSQLLSGPETLNITSSHLDINTSSSRVHRKCRSLESFPSMRSDSQRGLNTAPCGRPRDELFGLKKERDHLARRVKDLEMDSAHNLAMTNSLLAEVGALSAEKRYLEDRLANYHHQIPHSSHNTCFTPVKQYELDDEAQDLSSTNPYKETLRAGLGTFSSTPTRPTDPVPRKLINLSSNDLATPSSDHLLRRSNVYKSPGKLGTLDGIVSSPSDRMRTPRGVKLSRYKEKMTAILKESNPLELQRHLLTTVFHNEILTYQVDNITKSRVELVCQLAKIKEENEDLKFQLEEKSIELEGTRARVRLYERLQTVKLTSGGDGGVHTLVPANPILPQLTLPCTGNDPQPLSSSTESAHLEDSGSSMDKLSVTRSPSKRRSKIPLKSYSAPRHPTDLSKSSNIPKYQKDTSWHSNQSRKSAESLNNTPLPPSSRNWDNNNKSVSHVVKKPAILSNKELSLASRRESFPVKPSQTNGESFARRMRKTSSESSSNSSGSSPRYAVKKISVSSQGPDTKLRPPTPLRKLGRPYRSRSLEKSSIITLPAVDEVNECGESLDLNPQPEPSETRTAVESNTKPVETNLPDLVTQGTEDKTLKQDNFRNPSTVMCTSKTREKHILSDRLHETNLKPQETVSRKSEYTSRISQETPLKTRQDKFLSTETQALVKQIQNNSDTYVVKTSEVRQGIPEFIPEQNQMPSSVKSHTYRVRKPNRFVEIGHRDYDETLGKQKGHEMFIEDRIKSSRQIQRNATIHPQNSKIQSRPKSPPKLIHPIENCHLATVPVLSINKTDSTEVGLNSVEYFDSIETMTSASGSVLYSMNSNRLVKETIAEYDSIDHSHPDISDSEDLV